MTGPPRRPLQPRVTYMLSDLGGGTGHHLIAVLESPPATRWSAEIISEVQNTSRAIPPVPLIVLPRTTGLKGKFPLQQFNRWRRLRNRFRSDPPDILHTYFFWSILYGRMLRAVGVVPKLVENREDMGFNWSRFEYLALRASRRLPDRIICVSDAVREVVLRREGVAPDRVSVVRNGVAAPTPVRSDSGFLLRDELGIPRSAPIVGMVANFQRPIKGAIYFVDALTHVAKRVPEVRFLLIGMGRNQAGLQARAERAGVGNRLLFTGFRDDVERFYDLMDVSALTSLSEGLSITILESMRHGVPVVATDVGGNREIVRDGTTGFLVPPRDPEIFAERVVELLSDPTKRREFGSEARVVVEAEFNLTDVAAAYLDIYRSLAPED